MKSLLIKEIKLAASPLSYFFLAFSAMTLIPGYPILIGTFFVCLGIFQTFQNSRESNDILYTVLLPVDKGDAVRAKYIFVGFIELLAWLLMAALTAVRMALLGGAAVYASNPMMNANLVYLAWAAAVFGLFNAVFLYGFFKTGYKFGKPFVTFVILSLAVVGIGETLHHVPGLEFLNGTERLPLQALILACGLIAYVVMTALSYHAARKRFELLDL